MKNLYKRYIVSRRIIQSIVFFSIVAMSIAFFATYSSGAKIGTCYTWDAEYYPSGVYFCILKQGYNQVTKKMGLVK
ncbi:MAG: hypothetical protein GF315_12365 [candidate division Zixibacteria bacterium]|nr:hypothetical protein [candidate division Zixibacteria bacterium]